MCSRLPCAKLVGEMREVLQFIDCNPGFLKINCSYPYKSSKIHTGIVQSCEKKTEGKASLSTFNCFSLPISMELLNRIPSEQVSFSLEWAEVTEFSTKTKGSPQFSIFLQSQTFQFVNIPCYVFFRRARRGLFKLQKLGISRMAKFMEFSRKKMGGKFSLCPILFYLVVFKSFPTRCIPN